MSDAFRLTLTTTFTLECVHLCDQLLVLQPNTCISSSLFSILSLPGLSIALAFAKIFRNIVRYCLSAQIPLGTVDVEIIINRETI